MNSDSPQSKSSTPRPRWLRWLLMTGLIALCALGFYFSNAAGVERFMDR